MRRRTFVITGTVLGLLLPQVAWGQTTYASGPLQARLAYCEPQWDCPQENVCETSPIAAHQPGYGGPGYHNVDGARRFRAQLRYFVLDPNDSPDAALDQVERIYLCRVTAYEWGPQNVDCPREEPWVIFDRAAGINRVPLDLVSGKADEYANGDAGFMLDLDWQDTTYAVDALVLRVQNVGEPEPGEDMAAVLPDAAEYGACSRWSLRSTAPDDTQFEVWGPTPMTLRHRVYPNLPTVDLCASTHYGPGWPKAPQTYCLTEDQAEYVRLWMHRLQIAHEDRLQGAVPDAQRHYGWRNGSDGAGGYNPHYLFVGPHANGNGQYTGGGTFNNPHDFWALDPLNSGTAALREPADAMLETAPLSLQLTMHEYVHSLQHAWAREQPATWALVEHVPFISEAHTKATEINLCIEQFPGAVSDADRRCMNSGKLGMAAGGRYEGKELLKEPRHELLTTPYHSGIFWGYLFEQFGYPVGRFPHPTGTPSLFQRPGGDNPPEPLSIRDSDEGVDLLGLLFQQFAATGPGILTFDAMDPALQTHLGRSFRDVVLDFHTALYLKDYTDTDPRWRFEWLDSRGYKQTDSISSAKPFGVPAGLVGDTCGTADASGLARCDGLVRTRRALDSWAMPATGGSPVPDYLGLDESRFSAGSIEIGPWSTTAVSVSPDPAWVGRDLRVELVRERARPLRYRLFRIEQDLATGSKTPEPLCEPECVAVGNFTQLSDVFSTVVPIGPNTVEVVAIASAGEQTSYLDYGFGPASLDLTVVSPNTAHPAFVGHPNTGRQSFLLAFSLVDDLGSVIDVTEGEKANLEIEVPNCVDPAGCVLPPDAYSMVPVSGGHSLAVVTLPDSFYPPGSGTLDVAVTYLGSAAQPSDIEWDALVFDDVGQQTATALVLDLSGSMSTIGTGKLEALRAVAKGVVSSLVLPDGSASSSQLAIVTFSFDADTPFPFAPVTTANVDTIGALIDGLSAWGLTSLGDGLLQAQYELGLAFDGAVDPPDRQSMVILSDGVNTHPAEPHLYYDRGAELTPTFDGNSDWSAVPELYYPDRVVAGLAVPEISAVAFGQDANLGELDGLTRLSGNAPLYVPDMGEAGPLTPSRMTLSLADGYGDAVSRSLGFERIGSYPITGSVEPPPPLDAPQGTGGADGGGAPEPGKGGATLDVDPEATGGDATGGEGGTYDVEPDPWPITTTARFQVEPGARELRVVVTAAEDGATAGTLRTPSLQVVEETAGSEDGRGRSFRVLDPEPGEWEFASLALGRDEPQVLVDATVRASHQLFVFSDTALLSDDGDIKAGAWVQLRAVPVDGQPIPNCTSVVATVTRPGTGAGKELTLQDDGQHGDGLAGDGVYGAVFSRTGSPGGYRVRVSSVCPSPDSGAEVHREQPAGFVTFSSPEDDSDGDGLPSWWEAECLDPDDPTDASSDHDGDGFSAWIEFQYGSSPCWDDTDGGGESDASELTSGRNPADPTDDRVSTPLPEVTPGDESVYIVPGMITAGGTLVAEWAPFEAGPWSDIPGPWQDGYVLHTGLTNGLEYCYRIQFTAPSGGRTAWSEPRCVVPNADPTPPRLEMIEGITYCSETSGWPLLRFYDQPFVSDYSVPRVDLGVSTSGVTEMRIWPGAGEAPEGTPWQFAVEEPAIPLVDGYTVYSVQVRDGAGNLSTVVLLPVRCTEQACDYEPATIGCCTSVTDCEGMADYALFASNSLRIADATVIGTPDPDVHAPIASAGTSEVNLGVEAVTGSLWTAGSLVVRDRGQVEGDAFAAGPIQLMNGASVTGERWQNADFLRFPPLSSFTVTFPSPPGPNVTVPPDSTRTLAPGSYGALNIGSRTKVYLRSGTYYFTSGNLEPGADVRFNTSAGPVYLYVKDSFTFKGKFVDSSGRHDQVMVGYFGTAVANVESAFSGTLVAPRARVELKTVADAHRGSFFAKELEVFARTRVEHHPFVGTWLGGAAGG